MDDLDPKRSLLNKAKNNFMIFPILAKWRLNTAMAVIFDWNYLWDFRCDGDSEQVHGHIHASHHDNEQAMARVAVGAQALLQEVEEDVYDTEATVR